MAFWVLLQSGEVVDPEWIKQGGFAFAALVFAAVLWVIVRAAINFAVKREEFIDRMLVRLEGNEGEHATIADAIRDNSLAIKDLASAHTRSVEIIAQAQTSAMNVLKEELNATRIELARWGRRID